LVPINRAPAQKRSLSGECACNENATQYSMYPIENLSASLTWSLKMQGLAVEINGGL